MKLPVYLDHNATTPCDPAVVEAMLPYFSEKFGNAASRSHSYGWEAEEAVDHAREQVARLIGAEPKEIVFTSGATEADNLALKGVFETYSQKGDHIITCNIEHKAVMDTCHQLEKRGAAITWLEVDRGGLIDIAKLEAAIRPTTILIAIMHGNNEIGTLMPMKEIGTLAKQKGILLFSDATQSVGKVPVNVNELGIDLMSFSAHKLYGPKGVGALYVRRKNPRVKLAAQMDGGGHEKGMRSGTLNVPGIVGFGKACEIAGLSMEKEASRLAAMRDKLQNAVLQIQDTYINGDTSSRLPHVCNVSFADVDGEALLLGLTKNIAVSSGSACTSASMEPSYVLKALGVEDNLAYSSIRFSLGRFTGENEVDFAIDLVSKTVKRLREESIVRRL